MTSATPPRKRFAARGCLIRVAAVVFGLLLALLIAEVGVRLAYHALPQTLQIALRDVRLTPFSDARLVPPPVWQADTDYQTITQPGLTNELTYGSPDVSFRASTYPWWGGRVGFRSAQPTDGHVDAVALGDSFTFCFVEASDCWVNLLAGATGLKIANLGQPVTGSVSHARIFKTFALPVKPPLVIWEFFGNDFNDDYGLAELDGTAKTPSAPQLGATTALPTAPLAVWLRQNSVIYTLISALLRRGSNQGVEQFVDPYHVQKGTLDLWFGQSYLRDAFDMTNPRNLEGETDSQQAILATRDLIDAYNGHILIVLVPTKEEVYSALTAPLMGQAAVDALSAPRRRLTDFCTAHGLTCLDLFPALQAQAASGVQLYFPRDLHLNPAGNQVASSAILQALQAHGWAK